MHSSLNYAPPLLLPLLYGVLSTSKEVDLEVGNSFTFPESLPREGFLRHHHSHHTSLVAEIFDWNVTLNNNSYLGKIEFDSVKMSMTIKNLQYSDSGTYSLESVKDKFIKDYRLNVYKKVSPKVTSELSEDGKCKLICSSNENKEDFVFWEKNSQQFKEKTASSQTLMLTKEEIGEVYTCRAKNPLGSWSAQASDICGWKENKGSRLEMNKYVIISAVVALLLYLSLH
ncbi:SLAM family member 5-like isoform X2 [Polypterus senegalus]|uniref:SLAM family member 5-like isoform X2 n=1 Tax=Polypterus senegalus TaxID=55291 RepID=UPI001964BC6F|nr:SLAM family member 5-like isoform X2 [Polypterus senegalus]